MRSFWDDARFGVRLLARTPGFAAAALVTLALGIGANTALLSLLDALFFRPLAISNAGKLVNVYQTRNGGGAFPLSLLDYFDYKQNSKSFTDLAAHYPTAPLHIVVRGESATVTGSVVTSGYFRVLGLQPVVGRFFLDAEDEVRDRDAVTVISHSLWRNRFDADPQILGQTININGRLFSIVGVAPPRFGGVFQGIASSDIWIPSAMFRLGYRYCDAFARDCTVVQIIGRLRSDVTLKAAQAELDVLARQIERASPSTNSGLGVLVVPARGLEPGPQTANVAMISLLLAGVTMVLLIACANVAGLLLVRGVKRRREIAIRLALGASRGRLIRQLLTEATLIAVGGGAIGLLVAIWANEVLRSFYATDYAGRPLQFDVDIRGWVLVVTAGLSMLTALISGLVPALLSSGADVVVALKDEGGTRGRRPSRFRDALVVLQVGCSMMLLVGAGLLVRSLQDISRGPGIDAGHVIMLRLRPSLVAYDGARAHTFHREVIRRLEQLPGVAAASTGESLPLFGSGSRTTIQRDDRDAPGISALEVTSSRVGDRYFEVLGVPVLEGREFDTSDLADGPPVAIVNDVLANRLWPGETVAGRTVRVGTRSHQIVGVVRAAQYHAIGEEAVPYLFLNYWQQNASGGWSADSRTHVRVNSDAAAMMPMIRREIAAIDPSVPLSEDYPLETRVAFTFAHVRMTKTLLVSFGVLAMVLTAIGLYGVVAFATSLRRREIAIRLALGARPDQVRRLVLSHGLTLAAFGTVLGLVGAIAGARVLSTLLYGVQPHDAVTFLAVAAILTAVALAASGIPARRAMRVDPALTLRQE